MKQDLERSGECLTSKKFSWRSNGKNDYQRKVPDHYIIPKSKEISFVSDVTAKTKHGSIEIWHQRFCHVNNDYLVKTSKNDSVKLPRLTDNEEDERGAIPTSAIKDLLKKWEAVRAMVLEWHPNQAGVSRVGDLYNDNAINYFRKILKKKEKQSTLDMFFNAP
ncbi:uncharacterized protein TNCV_1692431 [Trichonephila clavipes]|nr:uncharacterized protein TNCV_1692431 [Trichonephila clavipes]